VTYPGLDIWPYTRVQNIVVEKKTFYENMADGKILGKCKQIKYGLYAAF